MTVCSIKWRKKTRFLTCNAAGVQRLRPDLCGNKPKQNKKNETVLAFLAMIYDYLFLSVCPEPVLANDRCAIEHSCWKTVFQTAVVSVRIPRDLLGSAG